MSGNKPLLIQKDHIQKGLTRYGNNHRLDLEKVLKAHDLQYTVKQFNDGRLLLIYENKEYAFLLEKEQDIYSFINQ